MAPSLVYHKRSMENKIINKIVSSYHSLYIVHHHQSYRYVCVEGAVTRNFQSRKKETKPKIKKHSKEKCDFKKITRFSTLKKSVGVSIKVRSEISHDSSTVI